MLQRNKHDVGIGGSCSDFLDYLKSCLSSGEVNLLFPHNGLDRVHLVATKAKGLPRITISLNTLTHSALNDSRQLNLKRSSFSQHQH
uniref:Uncharacterized protein n=1 Tax=Oryza rufipogon TaxID=4529 RepID=A0A0E0PG99_ORYRU